MLKPCRHWSAHVVFFHREGVPIWKVVLVSARNKRHAFERARLATRGRQEEGEPLVARKLGRKEIISLDVSLSLIARDEELIARALERRKKRCELMGPPAQQVPAAAP